MTGIETSIIDPELALRLVREEPLIAFDTETTGLKPGVNKICGYVFTNWSVSIYIPVRHEAGGNIPNPEEFEKELAAAFKDRAVYGYRTVGHNLGFDLRFCLWGGIEIRGNLEDTMINESLIDDRTIGYSLDDCCARHQVTAKKGADLYAAIARRFGGIPDRNQMAHFWRMPGDDPYVLDYATGDGVSTIELWQSQQPILDEENLRVPWQLECDVLGYLPRIHRRGILVDQEYAHSLLDENGILDQKIKEIASQFPPGFNPRSPTDVQKLYLANGFTDDMFARTDSGLISFTEKWLETNDLGSMILKNRQLLKARDSFISPIAVRHNIDGRIHPILNQSKSDEYGASGARFSCSDPNMQAVSKRNRTMGELIRRLVIPDKGMVIEEADAMQQEPRFFTHYSRDPALVEGYRNDPKFSIHRRASDMMFGGEEYDKAKRMAMGILSMMYPKALAGHLRISVKEATDLRNRFLYNAFPEIGKFQQDVVSVFEKRKYVKSILGRKARLSSSKFAYKGVSRVIQNSGGDHNKTCLLRACQYEDAHPEVQVLMSVHDSIQWQRYPDHSPKELVAALENVATEFNLIVPIPFEVGSGSNWAESSYGPKIKDKIGWQI